MASMRGAIYTGPRVIARPASLRPFSLSTARFAGKEDSLHQEDRAEEAERHKQEQLKDQKDGKGKWRAELASNSESIIKAERGEIEASADTIEKLQKESEKLMKQKR